MPRTTLTITLATVAAVAAVAAAVALTVPAAGHATGDTATANVLSLDARFTSSHTTGRLEVAKDKISLVHHVVGHDDVACAMVTSAQFECSFTEVITGHGTLQAEGYQGNTNAPLAMAIVGGTGAYTGASGTMTTSDEKTSVEHYRLSYTLPAH